MATCRFRKFTNNRKKLSPVWALWVLFLLTGCGLTRSHFLAPVDFSRFQDQDLPLEAAAWLGSGPQSRITPAVAAVAGAIEGRNRRERVYGIVDYVWQHFGYDSWLRDRTFGLTVDELLTRKVLGGCSDYALVQTTLFRASGIPARLIMTANVDWMLDFQKNDLLLAKGHVFIEAYLEDKWYLVDGTYGFLYLSYDPNSHNFPRGEIRCWRGRDYWSGGIDSVDRATERLRAAASGYQPGGYVDPEYPWDVLWLIRPNAGNRN